MRPSKAHNQGGLAMPHKFAVGDSVQFHPVVWPIAARGPYLVTMLLPESAGQFEYRIRSPNEPHERIARESELKRMAELSPSCSAVGAFCLLSRCPRRAHAAVWGRYSGFNLCSGPPSPGFSFSRGSIASS